MAEHRFHRPSLPYRFCVFYKKLNQPADRGDFSRTDSGARREAKYHLRKSLSLRKSYAGFRRLFTIRLHKMTYWIKVKAAQHVLGPKYLIKHVSTNASHCLIDLEHYVLVVTFFIFLVSQ